MLSLSSNWNLHRHTDGELLLREILDLGFGGVTIANGTKPSLMAGMKRMIRKGRIRAIALEGYFPAPPGFDEPEFTSRYHLTSTDAGDRAMALRWSAQTLDYASDLGAQVQLLDLGSTGMGDVTGSLARLAGSNRLHSRQYVKSKLKGIDRRSQISTRFLDRARKALDTLLPLARAKGVKLALSSQWTLEAIPDEKEIQTLIHEYQDSGALGYWHDFGAAQVKTNLGFLGHEQWLQEIKPSVLGTFVHDVAWPDRPSRLPLGGMIRYRELLPLLPERTPFVWRIAPSIPPQELRQALTAWDDEFSLVS